MKDRVVKLTSVMRGGSLIVGGFSVMSLIAFYGAGEVIIHPMVALALLVCSVGFFLMSLCEE